jgi:hypothetical protein
VIDAEVIIISAAFNRASGCDALERYGDEYGNLRFHQVWRIRVRPEMNPAAVPRTVMLICFVS